MQPTKYDARVAQAAQNRQHTHLNGARKYVQSAVPRPSGQASSSMYMDDSYNEGSNGDRYWEESGGPQSGCDKPTGLRHFSTKVCEKVKEKGLTNYNEVADELVSDYFQNNVMKHIDVVKQEYDMKNIRRRVYDALNVLLAMNIITKNKKDIRWIGLPASASQEITRLEEEKTRREASIKTKMETLHDMIMQIVAYKNLVEKNRKNEHENGRPDRDSVLHLPFLIIHTDKDANVECSVSSDKSEFLFSFDKRFEINDDFEVLKKMKMACGLDTGSSTEDEIKTAKEFLPELHQHYVDEILSGHKRLMEEREEKRKQQLTAQAEQAQYYEQSPRMEPAATPQLPHASRFNRQLQEHLMTDDGSEDHTAVAGITEKDNVVEEKDPGPIARVPMYSYSPQKMRQMPTNSGMSSAPQPTTTRRYFVQKTPQGAIKREVSPAVRSISRPYPAPMSGERRMAAGSGSVTAPVKYYVSQGQNSMQYPQTSQRYRIRPPPPANQQRVVYTSANQLPPGQRIISQRVVGPGGPHPPGTIIRKVIRKVVVNSSGGQKPSPAQQVIQKKMMEQQDMHERKPEQPMTSAQAAALIQHPPQEEYDYF